MSNDPEMLEARLFMAEVLGKDSLNADPDVFVTQVNIAAEGLVAARNNVAFHHILENNGLTIEE